MSQERLIAQVKPRLQHCLEQRDGPGILALTMWLVHRHGHGLLERMLSQPEWSSHRLWWDSQIGHLSLDLQPQSELQHQSQPRLRTIPTGKDHQDGKTQDKTPVTAEDPLDQPEPMSIPQHHPEPQERSHLDGQPANQGESLDHQALDGIKMTPAQVTKQRLKADKAAKSAFSLGEDGEVLTVTPAASKERPPQRKSPGRQHRSLQLRSWLPCNQLPHQDVS